LYVMSHNYQSTEHLIAEMMLVYDLTRLSRFTTFFQQESSSVQFLCVDGFYYIDGYQLLYAWNLVLFYVFSFLLPVGIIAKMKYGTDEMALSGFPRVACARRDHLIFHSKIQHYNP
jgi:hypothetical protein